MAATFLLSSQPRAGDSPQVLRHGILGHRCQQLHRPLVVIQRQMGHDGITVVVVVQNIECFGVFAFLQQLHAAGIGRIQLRGVYRVLDHPFTTQIMRKFTARSCG